MDRRTNGGYDIGGIAPGADDQHRPGLPSLGNRKDRGRLRIFTERELFAIRHHAHNLNRGAGKVFEVSSHGIGGVKQAAGELPIHDGYGRGFGGVGEADIAPGKQRNSGRGQKSGRSLIIKGVKLSPGRTEIGGLLREDQHGGRIETERSGVGVPRGFDSRDGRDAFQQLALETIRGGTVVVAGLIQIELRADDIPRLERPAGWVPDWSGIGREDATRPAR